VKPPQRDAGESPHADEGNALATVHPDRLHIAVVEDDIVVRTLVAASLREAGFRATEYTRLRDAEAGISIGGDVSVVAQGSSAALAYIGNAIASGNHTAGANLSIVGDLDISASASAGDARAYLADMHAYASDDGTANVTVGGNLKAHAVAVGSGYSATAYNIVSANATTSNAVARVQVGDIHVTAVATSGHAHAGLYLGAFGYGEISAGSVYVTANGSNSNDAQAQIVANDDGAISLGDLYVNNDDHGTLWLDLYAEDGADLTLGDVYIQAGMRAKGLEAFKAITPGTPAASVAQLWRIVSQSQKS